MKTRTGFRYRTAVYAGKLTAWLCRKLGYEGETWAGKISRMICPDILQILVSQVRECVFVVCGTNGKTTTNNLLYRALEAEGKKVVANHTGSNMRNGVTAAFVKSTGRNARLNADYACIEVDEASCRQVFPELKPDTMILTNLFRDQLDRYGEIDITMELLKNAVGTCPDLKLIVNADDPLCVSLAQESGKAFRCFGIRSPVEKAKGAGEEIREGRFCRRCGKPLSYRFFHFSQLGDYYCPACGFERPEANWNASGIETGVITSFTAGGHDFTTSLKGIYNIYNILAAWAGVRSTGSDGKHFQEMLSRYEPGNGRSEVFSIHGARVILNLAKNPAGFNQNLRAMLQDPAEKDVIIVINDHAQDGRDVSWLWDVDFELLSHPSVRKIAVGGTRRHDMGLRLKYEEIAYVLTEHLKQTVNRLTEKGTGRLYVLVNYTALYKTRNMLEREAGKNEAEHRTSVSGVFKSLRRQRKYKVPGKALRMERH